MIQIILKKMKVSIDKLLLAMMIIGVSCTSGKDSPVDSHPGSGSFKGSSDTTKQKNSSPEDTTKKDRN
jgi:hypothetical protein